MKDSKKDEAVAEAGCHVLDAGPEGKALFMLRLRLAIALKKIITQNSVSDRNHVDF